MNARNAFEVLGIEPTTNEKAVRNAYKQLIRQFHPDKCKDADANEKTQAIADAYQLIDDQVKLNNYYNNLMSPSSAAAAAASTFPDVATTRSAAASSSSSASPRFFDEPSMSAPVRYGAMMSVYIPLMFSYNRRDGQSTTRNIFIDDLDLLHSQNPEDKELFFTNQASYLTNLLDENYVQVGVDAQEAAEIEMQHSRWYRADNCGFMIVEVRVPIHDIAEKSSEADVNPGRWNPGHSLYLSLKNGSIIQKNAITRLIVSDEYFMRDPSYHHVKNSWKSLSANLPKIIDRPTQKQLDAHKSRIKENKDKFSKLRDYLNDDNTWYKKSIFLYHFIPKGIMQMRSTVKRFESQEDVNLAVLFNALREDAYAAAARHKRDNESDLALNVRFYRAVRDANSIDDILTFMENILSSRPSITYRP